MLSKWQWALLNPSLDKKVKEFHKAGYPEIKREDLINYLKNYVWKRQSPTTYLKKLQTIKEVTCNRYFDYLQLQATSCKSRSLEEINIDSLL